MRKMVGQIHASDLRRQLQAPVLSRNCQNTLKRGILFASVMSPAPLDEIIDLLWIHPEHSEWRPKVETVDGLLGASWLIC